jgi:AAHS family 4-hydroxybenzoate transporter-like MFS transporter
MAVENAASGAPALLVNEVNVARVVDSLPVRRSHLLIWALCFIDNLFDGYDGQLMAFAAPAITTKWHISPATFAIVFVATSAGFFVGNFGSGPIADRVGRKWTAIAATAIYALATLLTPALPTITPMALLRFIAGVGLGALMTNAFALISEYAPAKYRATMIGAMFAGSPLGGVIAGLVSARLIPQFGWELPFIIGGILPLALLPLLMMRLPESVRFLVARGHNRNRIATLLNALSGEPRYRASDNFVLHAQPARGFFLRQLFTDGRAMSTSLIAILYVLNQATLFFIGNWLPLLLHQARVPATYLLEMSSLFFLGGAVGGAVLGRCADRFGRFTVLIPAYVVTLIVASSIGRLTDMYPILALAIFVTGFCGFGGQIGTHAITASVYPTAIRSSGIAWAQGMGRLGAIIGSGAGGALMALGLGTANLFLALAVPAGGSLVALTLLRSARRGLTDAD